MFATDSQSRISWFQARSPEPLYHYELLGLLMSLAVYNGVTLPVSFPLALYRKLLELPVTGLAHIRDGWPELSRGLDSLLSWRDGDVADVFLRTYDFSVEAFGAIVSMAMDEEQALSRTSSTRKGKGKARVTESPPPSSPTRMVTNENREQYVRDYVSWLTDRSIRAQYEAFARGFSVCLEKRSLSVRRTPHGVTRHRRPRDEDESNPFQIFTPEALRRLVEGVPEIDMDALEETTRYEDGFGASHWLMREFWKVVKAYPVHKQRDLLEFVTASDRVPVNGIRSVLFVIQRNGPDSEVRIPAFFPPSVNDTLMCPLVPPSLLYPWLPTDDRGRRKRKRRDWLTDAGRWCNVAPPNKSDLLRPPLDARVQLHEQIAREIGPGAGERKGIWRSLIRSLYLFHDVQSTVDDANYYANTRLPDTRYQTPDNK